VTGKHKQAMYDVR